MAIKILEEPDVYLSLEEYERLQKEYASIIMYMVDPPSFDVWVRKLKARK